MRMYLCPACGDACSAVRDKGTLAAVLWCMACRQFRSRDDCATVNIGDTVKRSCWHKWCANFTFTVTGFGLDYMTVRGVCGHNTIYGAGSMVPDYPER
jgi:hypothetical protein